MWKYTHSHTLVPEQLNCILTKEDTGPVTVFKCWPEAAYYCGVDILSGTYTLVFD